MKNFKCALVTGATSGIGKVLAKFLQQKGIPLLLTGRDIEKLQELKYELAPLEVIQADLSQPEGRKRILQAIHTYAPDLVINNAGLGYYGSALELDTQKQMAILEVNGTAVAELTLEAAKALKVNNQAGVIMNISSSAGFQVPFPQFSMYAASKTFVNALSLSLDYEFKPYHIRVLASCPGPVATNFASRAAENNKFDYEDGIMTAEFAANEIWNQIVSEKSVRIFDWKYRLLTGLSKLFPEGLRAKILSQAIEKRKK